MLNVLLFVRHLCFHAPYMHRNVRAIAEAENEAGRMANASTKWEKLQVTCLKYSSDIAVMHLIVLLGKDLSRAPLSFGLPLNFFPLVCSWPVIIFRGFP